MECIATQKGISVYATIPLRAEITVYTTLRRARIRVSSEAPQTRLIYKVCEAQGMYPHILGTLDLDVMGAGNVEITHLPDSVAGTLAVYISIASLGMI